MSTDSASKFRDLFVAQFAPDMAAAAQSVVDGVLNQEFVYSKERAFDANSNSTSVHTLDMSTLNQMRVRTFKWSTRANVTADNTNLATVQLVYNNGNSGSDTVIATSNTATTAGGGSGNLTLEVPFAFTINATNAVVPAGSQVQVKVTKAGAGGLLLPHSSFEVKASPV
jgi:hypothetical protein